MTEVISMVRAFMMTTFKQKRKKEMTEASASVCLLLATALQLVFGDVHYLTEQLILIIFHRQVYCLSDTC